MPRIPEHDADNPVWTKEDFARAVPFSGLPAGLQVKLRAIQDANSLKDPHKIPVRLRLSPDVVKALEDAGGDISARVDEILKERLVA